MPDDLNQGLSVEAAQPAAAQSADGDSGDWLDDKAPSEENALFGDLLRSGRASIDSSTTRPADTAADGQSTPAEGDEAPSDDPLRDAAGRFIPRRGIPKAVEAAEQRAAAAEAKVAELSPEKLREQVRAEIEAEARQKSDTEAQARLSESAAREAELYERSLHMADTDPRLSEPSPNPSMSLYDWREARKELLAQYPQADAHYRAQYSRQELALLARHDTIMNGIADQMGTVAGRLGIDHAAWKAKGITFADMAADIESAIRAEYRAVEDENRQLRLTGPRGLASARTGLNGGMSHGGATPFNENDEFRRMLRGD